MKNFILCILFIILYSSCEKENIEYDCSSKYTRNNLDSNVKSVFDEYTSYYKNGRLVKVVYPNVITEKYTYNKNGDVETKIIIMKDIIKKSEYIYNENEELIQLREYENNVLKYYYIHNYVEHKKIQTIYINLIYNVNDTTTFFYSNNDLVKIKIKNDSTLNFYSNHQLDSLVSFSNGIIRETGSIKYEAKFNKYEKYFYFSETGEVTDINTFIHLYNDKNKLIEYSFYSTSKTRNTSTVYKTKYYYNNLNNDIDVEHSIDDRINSYAKIEGNCN